MTQDNVVTKNPLCDGNGRVFRDNSYSPCNCQTCVLYLLGFAISDAQVPLRYRDASLDSIQAESSAQAAGIARAKEYVATWPIRQKLGEGMAFFGRASRMGKTHIAVAALRDIGMKYLVRFGLHDRNYEVPLFFLSASAYIWSWRQFYARPRAPEGQDDPARWSEHKRLTRNEEFAHTAPLLLIDDLGEVSGTEFAAGKLYELVEYRVSNLLPIIVTSNLSWTEIAARYGDSGVRVVGRLQEITSGQEIHL